MKCRVEINSNEFFIDMKNYYDISIKLDFAGEQPNLYGVSKAKAKPFSSEDFIGDTRLGGSCNFEDIYLNPHCNGTHTESIGHIVNDRIRIADVLEPRFFSALLITVLPTYFGGLSDKYYPNPEADDMVISKISLQKSLALLDKELKQFQPEALIIRTLPNLEIKKSLDYTKENAPYFTAEAVDFINAMGIKHIVVDLPSLDKSLDQGKLSSHRLFWGVERNCAELSDKSLINKTITELVYIDNEISDGLYLTQIHIPLFLSDAAPSRVVLYPVLKQ